MEKVVSFAIGDVVAHANKSPLWCGLHKGKYIISGVSTSTGNLEYSINGCSWFTPKGLVLIHRATKETLKEAMRLEDEDE